MTFETLLLENQQGTSILRINRPSALNALNNQVMVELEQALLWLEHDTNTQSLVLTGTGEKAFVAGADITELNRLDYEEALALSTRGQRVFQAIEDFPKPVVAAVNGFALGGGCELAMACHLRVAAQNARFGQPEVNLGIIAGYGGTQRLPRLVGKGKALELLLTGDALDAQQALALGLVNHVVPAEELLPFCLNLLQKCHQKGPLALRHTIAAVNAGYDPLKNGFEAEAVHFARSVETQDAREGTTAFLEKRKPQFTGQ